MGVYRVAILATRIKIMQHFQQFYRTYPLLRGHLTILMPTRVTQNATLRPERISFSRFLTGKRINSPRPYSG
ncbi:hypothetical protein ACJ73_09261 [Blastomyces percursus]|uniref:Uncharacterized protein n=1 Tax=Blastomyces percursus TaxID=1658174 RepID=A0A1J9PAD0_9EURO|nr:hypothetical protein ACJ73_09261 [Blastomyces percursus]